MFLDFKSDLSRVVRFPATAGYGNKDSGYEVVGILSTVMRIMFMLLMS